MSASSAAASRPEVGVLIPAAGRGVRAGAGAPKQFRPIGGVPMLLRAIRPFARHAAVRHIVVALPLEHAATPPDWLAALLGDRLVVVPGGATRTASVRAALARLDPACAVVLVHDAARPFVTTEEIDAVIAAVQQGTGAVPALPVADTLKRSDDGLHVAATVPRDGLWRALTPQGFTRTMLEAAFQARPTATGLTDEAALVEAAGGTVVLVAGSAANIKVTTDADFRLAELVAAG